VATRYDDIWHEHISQADTDAIHDRTGYSEREIIQGHLETFMSLPGMEEEPRYVKYDLWEQYTEAMINGNNRDEFFANVGIDPRDFDWEGWREMMGYNRE
jgi:hypothetical protein